MFNQYALNDAQFNGSSLSSATTQDAIAFDGFGLMNSNIMVTSISYDDLGKMDLNSFPYPRNDGGGVLSRFFRGYDITCQLTLTSDTAANFAALLDTFKKGLNKVQGNLDILPLGSTETRRIKATVTSIQFDRQSYNVTFCHATVVFTALEPYFYATNMQSWFFGGKTATFNEEITNLGSAITNPCLYIIFGAGSACSDVKFTAFGKTLDIPGSFVSGDLLIINCDATSVTKNGTLIDYSGIFPVFVPVSNPFQVSFTGTVLADVTLLLPKNYL